MKRILLLGHRGTIGRRLEARARERFKGAHVVGASLPDTDLRNKDHVAALRALVGPDTAVVMLAAIKRQLGDSQEIFQKNMEMVSNVAELLASHRAGHVTYVSSAAVYGEDIENRAITETTPPQPRTFYGRAKYAGEQLLEKAVRQQAGVSLLILRPPLVYAPSEEGTFYGPSGFAKTAVKNETLTLWGDGTELREFLFADDLATIVCDLMEKRFDGTLNPVSGHSRSFADILAVLKKLLGCEVRVNERPRSKDKVDNVFKNDALRRALPDFSFTSLEDGLRAVVEAERASRPS